MWRNLTIAVGAGSFGAVLGAYRGGVQILFAGIKLPLVVLLTAAICAPALSAINGAMGRSFDLRRDLAIVLVALATGCLALAAMAPIVLFGQMWGLGYHELVLLAVMCCTVAGAFGFVPLLVGLWQTGREGVIWTIGALFLVFALVGSQMSWTLRPYLLRPRTEEVPFVRQVEGSFLDSVFTSLSSANGRYMREYAPLPGEASPFGRTR